MTDSDSEAFESADEEVEDKKLKKVVSHFEEKEKKTELSSSQTHQPKQKVPDISLENQQSKAVPAKSESEVFQEKTPSDEPPKQVETPVSSWRSWGAFNVISNASKTVASITTQVSQSIIDSINIPDPEEMAKLHSEEQKKSENPEKGSNNGEKDAEKSDDSMFKFDSLLSGVSQISSKVVAGGLDTLEGIGKKTINILQDTDPNIKNKIRNISQVNSKPNLSDLLKEAKDRVDDDSPKSHEKSLKIVSFEYLLDEYAGLVFLEALEILSNQSKLKMDLLIQPLSGKVLTDIEETLAEVKELCELDAENLDDSLTAENLQKKLQAAIEDVNVKVNFNEIVNHANETQKWLDQLDSSLNSSSIYEKSIQAIAKSCALSLNNLQKLAELLLSQGRRSTADEADSLTQLASIYCSLFNYLAIMFTEKFTAKGADVESKKLATNVFLESANATTYIKKAFNLFIPILQIGAV